jgi:hypothetical protein
MVEITGKDLARYQQWRERLKLLQKPNIAMNLRLFLLRKTTEFAREKLLVEPWMNEIEPLTETAARINRGYYKLRLADDNLLNRSNWIRSQENDFAIVAPIQGEALTEFQGFGIVPLIVGSAVAVVVIVAAAYAAVNICDSMQAKTIADLKLAQLQAEKTFSNSPPAVQDSWLKFKKLQEPVEQTINRLSSGSLVDKIGMAGNLLLLGLGVFLVMKVFGK